MYFSIDRKTGGKAMLVGEDKKPLEVPLAMLPPGAKEGEMLLYQNGKFLPAEDKTKERRERVSETLAMLLKRGDAVDDGDD